MKKKPKIHTTPESNDKFIRYLVHDKHQMKALKIQFEKNLQQFLLTSFDAFYPVQSKLIKIKQPTNNLPLIDFSVTQRITKELDRNTFQHRLKDQEYFYPSPKQSRSYSVPSSSSVRVYKKKLQKSRDGAQIKHILI